MPEIDSSAIASARYDTARRVLEITFTGGRVYDYRGVPEAIWTALLKADSKGRFFNAQIRDVYPATRRR